MLALSNIGEAVALGIGWVSAHVCKIVSANTDTEQPVRRVDDIQQFFWLFREVFDPILIRSQTEQETILARVALGHHLRHLLYHLILGDSFNRHAGRKHELCSYLLHLGSRPHWHHYLSLVDVVGISVYNSFFPHSKYRQVLDNVEFVRAVCLRRTCYTFHATEHPAHPLID